MKNIEEVLMAFFENKNLIKQYLFNTSYHTLYNLLEYEINAERNRFHVTRKNNFIEFQVFSHNVYVFHFVYEGKSTNFLVHCLFAERILSSILLHYLHHYLFFLSLMNHILPFWVLVYIVCYGGKTTRQQWIRFQWEKLQFCKTKKEERALRKK